MRCDTTPSPRLSGQPASPGSVDRVFRGWMLACFVGAMLALQSGCTTILGNVGFQEPLDAPAVSSRESEGESPTRDETPSTVPVPDDSVSGPEIRRAAEDALEAAVDRLAASGRLDPNTQDALTQALEGAPPQDWSAIIDAFVVGIESTPAAPRAIMQRIEQAQAATPTAEPPKEEPVPSVPRAPIEAETVPQATEPAPETLTVVNACFASKVRGWGSVDRFATSHFKTGQELIVYFELENLTSKESQSGHTTRIDTTLQLVSADGRAIHEWRFDPIEETCRSPRRDYFARYVLRIPNHLPGAGPCRLNLSVTDTVARCTAVTSLPMEIADRLE